MPSPADFENLPREIQCNFEWIDSRSCCYSIPGFAHLDGCASIGKRPKWMNLQSNHHPAHSYLLGKRLYDTHRRRWVVLSYYWLGSEGWPSTVQVRWESDPARTYDISDDEPNRLVTALAVCAGCEGEMLPCEDYLCESCRETRVPC